MYRWKLEELKIWKGMPDRKPLIIKGAKQVGKTWLMLEFGKSYEKYAYINLQNNNIKQLFSSQNSLEKIIQGIEIESGVTVEPENTLIILDEIQDNLEILKYFYENTKQYHIISACDSLQIDIENVQIIELFPLNFYEFLYALGEKNLLELIKNKDFEMLNIFSNKLNDYLKQYLYIGGMPEVVDNYIKNKNFQDVRKNQLKILKLYEEEFQKDLTTVNYKKIVQLIESIPNQLKKQNKRFIYEMLRKSARARDYKIVLSYAIKKGLVYKIDRMGKYDSFKLYLLDVRTIMCNV